MCFSLFQYVCSTDGSTVCYYLPHIKEKREEKRRPQCQNNSYDTEKDTVRERERERERERREREGGQGEKEERE